MAWNPPTPIPQIVRPPTRIVATSGNIAAGAVLQIAGGNARQDRIQIIITNLDPATNLTLELWNGQAFGTAFAQRPITLETTADIQIHNTGAGTVSVQVCELYPDIGNQHGVPQPFVSAPAAPAAPGAPAGGGTTTNGGTTSGAASSGGSFSGGSTGGSVSGPSGFQPR